MKKMEGQDCSKGLNAGAPEIYGGMTCHKQVWGTPVLEYLGFSYEGAYFTVSIGIIFY